MDAGLELLGELTPRDLTPGVICVAAKMKRPSFYTYFDSVDALLADTLVREVSRLEGLYEAQEEEGRSALYRLARIPFFIFRQATHELSRLKAFTTLFGYMQFPTEAQSVAIDEGGLTLAPHEVEVFTQIYLASLMSLITRHTQTAMSANEIIDAIKILLRGAGADPDELDDIFQNIEASS
jgi:AcrR family transcriptional regulator